MRKVNTFRLPMSKPILDYKNTYPVYPAANYVEYKYHAAQPSEVKQQRK
jgi:hypothetical protein